MLFPTVFLCLLSIILCNDKLCGTPRSEVMEPPRLHPTRRFVLNAPFDVGFIDFFGVENVSKDRNMFFFVDKNQFHLPKVLQKLIIRDDITIIAPGKTEHVDIFFPPFEYDEELSSLNISLVITYGNVPWDAKRDSRKKYQPCYKWRERYTGTIHLPFEFNL